MKNIADEIEAKVENKLHERAQRPTHGRIYSPIYMGVHWRIFGRIYILIRERIDHEKYIS